MSAVFGGLFFLFCLWFWSKEPNLHRIRAALIFHRLPAREVPKPQTGKILWEKQAPESLKSFVQDTAAAPLSGGGDLASAMGLAQRLIAKNYPPIDDAKTGPEVKLNRILAGKASYCSDYMEAFIGLCTAGGIPAREWGITADELKGPNGHSLVEIWNRQIGRWQVVDPFVGGWPSKADRPEKGIGIVDYVNEPKTNILWNPLSGVSLKDDLIQTVYNADSSAVFIIGDQRIFQPVKEDTPVAVRQIIQIMTGKSFRFFFPEIEMNRSLLHGLFILRLCMIGGTISGFLFIATVILCVVSRREKG